MDGGPDDSRGRVIAIDVQRSQTLFHISDGLVIETDELTCLLKPHSLDENLAFYAHAAEQIAGIAPAGPEACELLFQNDDVRSTRP